MKKVVIVASIFALAFGLAACKPRTDGTTTTTTDGATGTTGTTTTTQPQ